MTCNVCLMQNLSHPKVADYVQFYPQFLQMVWFKILGMVRNGYLAGRPICEHQWYTLVMDISTCMSLSSSRMEGWSTTLTCITLTTSSWPKLSQLKLEIFQTHPPGWRYHQKRVSPYEGSRSWSFWSTASSNEIKTLFVAPNPLWWLHLP